LDRLPKLLDRLPKLLDRLPKPVDRLLGFLNRVFEPFNPFRDLSLTSPSNFHKSLEISETA
jgi:hypothetical protein